MPHAHGLGPSQTWIAYSIVHCMLMLAFLPDGLRVAVKDIRTSLEASKVGLIRHTSLRPSREACLRSVPEANLQPVTRELQMNKENLVSVISQLLDSFESSISVQVSDNSTVYSGA